MEKVIEMKAAKRLGISRIKSRPGLTLAEQAVQVDAQIQQEVVSGISSLLTSRKFYTILVTAIFSTLLLLFVTLFILFYKYPLQTSNYFGFYYQNNASQKQTPLLIAEKKAVLAAQTGPDITPTQTSIFADILKPIAEASLIAVKTVDTRKYDQIVTNPAVVPSFPQTGSVNLSGADGSDGLDGLQGPAGPQGSTGIGETGNTGATGPTGAAGTTGSTGANGISITDVMTTTGDMIIRNALNTTARLPVGSSGQVLTSTGGIPTWENSSGGSGFSNLSSGTNTAATMTVGSGATLTYGGTGVLNANQLEGLTWAIPGAIGATTPNTGAFTALTGTTVNGLTITSNGTNTLTIAAGKTLTASNSLTFTGTDGTSFTLPTTSDDIVGRTVTQTLTNKTIAAGSNTISGLAVSNFSSANISQWTNDSGYLTSEVDTLATVTGRGATTSTGLTLNGGITTTTTTALTMDSGTTGAVNLGTGASAKTITVGNSTGATAVNINSGTGNVNVTVGPTSSSGKVQIGNSASTTPDLLVLDNGTADPTGVAGGMYYNTSTTKFRCFQNGVWTNCISGDKQLIGKTTDQSVTSSTTLTNDTALTFSVGSGETWIFNFFLFVSNNNSAGPDFKSAILGTTGWTCNVQMSGSEANGAAFPQRVATDCDNTPTAMVNAGIGADGSNGFNVRVQGVVTTNSAGSVTLQFAQNTSNATAITMKAGSYVQAFKVGGADLAELYGSKDATIMPGDVVSVDSSLVNGVQKSATPYDPAVLGIVSTNPGMVLGDSTTSGTPVLVALSGRVPVSVSTENGAIQAGDYLTTSSLPGVAMKATKAGTIIGTAMTDFNEAGVGTVVVFVKNGSSLGSNGEGIDGLMQLLDGSSSNLNDQVDISNEANEASSSTKPAQTKSTIETNLISYITHVVTDLFKNTVAFFGNVMFHSDVTFLGRPTFNKDTAGHALIKTGDSEVSINFDKEYAHNPVVTANINLVDGITIDDVPSYAVYNVTTKGFTIKSSKTAAFDINFSWIALGVNEETESTSAPTQNPTPVPTLIPSLEIAPTPTPQPEADRPLDETPDNTASSSANIP